MAAELVRAVVATGDRALVRIEAIPPPVSGAGEVVVDVSAISVNRGELHRLREAVPGWRPGWDFAGTVVTGDSAFRPGRRVVGIAGSGGAWAERVSVPADHLAPLPADLDGETAAALPVAGLTALRVLRLAGELAGRRVLVTGAAGGVGRFAVQLAAAGGASVTAAVRGASRASGLSALGAVHVLVHPTAAPGDFDLVLESAGGDSLACALDRVAPHGLVVTFGSSSRAPTTVDVARFYPKQAVLRGYYLLEDLRVRPPAGDLAELVALAARGHLRVDLGAVGGVDELPEVLHALAERRLAAGKAVLRMR